MRVAIDKNTLSVPLYRAQGVVDRKTPNNVLACVHIAAADGTLTFTATDYDITLTTEVSADVPEAGAALVNGRDIFEVVRVLPDGASLEVSSDDSHRVLVQMKGGRGRYNLNGLAPEEFPLIEEEGAGVGLSVEKHHIQQMLNQTLFSASKDESRPALNGVLMEIAPAGDNRARITMVSTDGHRLSKVERELDAADYDGSSHRAIVHRRGAHELTRILEGSDPAVRIEVVGRNIVFTSDRARLQIRQIEETFPDYQRILPDPSGNSVMLSRAAFIAAIKRVSALASGKNNLLRVDIEPEADGEPGMMTLEMVHADRGDAHERLVMSEYSGPKVSVGFNPTYLLDVCSVLKVENLQVEISDQFSPCLLHSEESPGATFVVMPMRL
jgi:DNA polymerase III subunit beta